MDLPVGVIRMDGRYLHTYRDLDSIKHVEMLHHMLDECHHFLMSLLGDEFVSGAKLSMGFHYPVRTQYSTLHMQVIVIAAVVIGDRVCDTRMR